MLRIGRKVAGSTPEKIQMMELSTLLAHHARFRPHATAVVFGEQRLDYRSFNDRVDRVAHLLHGLGVSKGERVATLLPNTLELL